MTKLDEQKKEIIDIWAHALLDCLCSALLPPCVISDDPRVVLGQVTVRKHDCKVLKVCNWVTERKFATTLPNLQYWLSVIPYMRQLRQLLEETCCNFKGIFKDEVELGEIAFNNRAFTKNSTQTSSFNKLILDVLAGRAEKISPEVLFKGLAGLKDKDGAPYLSDEERGNLLPKLLLDRLGPAMFGTEVPEGLSAVVGKGAGFVRKAEETSNNVMKIEAKLVEMQKATSNLKKEINKLNKIIKPTH